MRRFHSYGPLDSRRHFTVPRTELIASCVEHLVGDPEGGHYFTIWAPRQTGKTWLLRQALEEIRAHHGDRFVVGSISMQGVVLKESDPPEAFLSWVPDLFYRGMGWDVPQPQGWTGWSDLFIRGRGPLDRPLILFIDEFDRLPVGVIDLLVGQFRDLYLNRESTWLHGLALVGVRAVLGVDSERGSPFNVQRSLHVPNLRADEVEDLFRQYQAESGQPVAPEVVERVHAVTRGQPGLVSWFGELLTEKYNPGAGRPITLGEWDDVYLAACQVEPNNTVLNLIKKARGRYRQHVLRLFGRADVPFSFDQPWCNYLYLNGIIDHAEVRDEVGRKALVCRFSSPFVQRRLYGALGEDLFGELPPVLALDPQDRLLDIAQGQEVQGAALLHRYRDYLRRLRQQGVDPWAGQPRRVDLKYTEAVGHFHLYAWLREALAGTGVVSPEFPTGNGKVDLHVLLQGGARGIIEVKSFTTRAELLAARAQAAGYAQKLRLSCATLAVFVPLPLTDEAALAGLSGDEVIDGVRIMTVAIGWA